MSYVSGVRKVYGLHHEITSEDLKEYRQAGYSRIGVPLGFFTVDGRLLTGYQLPKLIPHSKKAQNLSPEADKIDPTGCWAPLSETVSGYPMKGSIMPEKSAQTVGRCILEELGVRPESLKLYAGSKEPCPETYWPVGYRSEKALIALSTILYFSPDFDTEKFEQNFSRTHEIGSIRFMTPDELNEQPYVRAGAIGWLDVVKEHGLTRPTTDLVPVTIPTPRPTIGQVDIKLDELPPL